MCFYMVYAPQPLRNHMWFRMVHTIRNHIQRSVVPDGARHSEPHLTEPLPPPPPLPPPLKTPVTKQAFSLSYFFSFIPQACELVHSPLLKSY